MDLDEIAQYLGVEEVEPEVAERLHILEFSTPTPGTDTQLSQEAQKPENKRKWRSRETRVAALQMLKTHTYKSVGARFGVSRMTLHLWQKQWEEERSLDVRGSRGRPRALTNEQVSRVAAQLDENPSATNEQLVANLGVDIHPASISRYTKRLGITRKKINDDEALLMDKRIINECKEYYQKVKDIPWERRVYMDESFVYDNEAPKMGRAPRGKRIYRARARHGKRWSIYFAIRHNDMVHEPIMRKENANDVNFLKYVKEDLVPCLKEGDVVIWDRLGKAGRCKNPKKQHYNPECKRLIEEAGATLMFLPPKGKYFNPIELSFGTIKTHIRNSYATSDAAKEMRPRTEDELREALNNAFGNMKPKDIEGYYRERADGRGFEKAFPDVWINII